MNKNGIAIISIIAAVILAAGILYVRFTPGQTVAVETPSAESLVGGDSDEHGCKGSAGYSWCAPKERCLRVWEEPCYSSVEQEIAYFLARKYGKNVSEVAITITKRNEDFVAGKVGFNDPSLPKPGPGGLFLATKKDSTAWDVVYDGNGSVDCPKYKTYGFPDDVLKGFCD